MTLEQLFEGLCDIDITYAKKAQILVGWESLPNTAWERACLLAGSPSSHGTNEQSLRPHTRKRQLRTGGLGTPCTLPSSGRLMGSASKPDLPLRMKCTFVRGRRRNESLSFLWTRGIMSLSFLGERLKKKILISAQSTHVVSTD